MASRISQMRNAALQPQLQSSQQPQLPPNDAIEYTRNLMMQMRNIPNIESVIMNLLQSNPQLSSILPLIHNGSSLENIAKSMAQIKNINLNELIQQLSGGI